MIVNFIMRFHNDTPNGGAKIVFNYANYLAKKNNEIKITFVADTPYKDRKYNKPASIKHIVKFLKDNNIQKKITWMNLDSKIKIDSYYSIKNIPFDRNEIIIAFDYGIILSLYDVLPNLNNCFYLIQHDEKVYYDKNIVRKAWRLPVTKIVISTWLYNKIKPYDDNVILIKNFVETKNFFVNNSIEDRKNVVSIIQHPNPSKGTKVGIDALKIVKKEIPDLRVIMFGTHSPSNNLPEYFTYYKDADVRTLRNSIYNKSAIYLLTSYLEGWGLTATEAMACGATLISTKNGGVDDFGIDNETALLSNPGDSKKMAQNIVLLLKNKSKRISMGYAGKRKVEGFTFEKSSSKFENVLLIKQKKILGGN